MIVRYRPRDRTRAFSHVNALHTLTQIPHLTASEYVTQTTGICTYDEFRLGTTSTWSTYINSCGGLGTSRSGKEAEHVGKRASKHESKVNSSLYAYCAATGKEGTLQLSSSSGVPTRHFHTPTPTPTQKICIPLTKVCNMVLTPIIPAMVFHYCIFKDLCIRVFETKCFCCTQLCVRHVKTL